MAHVGRESVAADHESLHDQGAGPVSDETVPFHLAKSQPSVPRTTLRGLAGKHRARPSCSSVHLNNARRGGAWVGHISGEEEEKGFPDYSSLTGERGYDSAACTQALLPRPPGIDERFRLKANPLRVLVRPGHMDDGLEDIRWITGHPWGFTVYLLHIVVRSPPPSDS